VPAAPVKGPKQETMKDEDAATKDGYGAGPRSYAKRAMRGQRSTKDGDGAPQDDDERSLPSRPAVLPKAARRRGSSGPAKRRYEGAYGEAGAGRQSGAASGPRAAAKAAPANRRPGAEQAGRAKRAEGRKWLRAARGKRPKAESGNGRAAETGAGAMRPTDEG